jgi:hypothetical protein
MSISYTVIMIRSAGAKISPEYSDRNLIVKTRHVKQVWLSGNCRAYLVVCQQQDTTRTANPVITATASSTQHRSGCISVCPVTVIVADTHSTILGLLSCISPQH